MKKIMAGQMTIFDMVVPVPVKKEECKAPRFTSIEEIVRFYDGKPYPACEEGLEQLSEDIHLLGKLYDEEFRKLGLYSIYSWHRESLSIEGYVSSKPFPGSNEGKTASVSEWNDVVLTLDKKERVSWRFAVDGEPGRETYFNHNNNSYVSIMVKRKDLRDYGPDGYLGNVTALGLVDSVVRKLAELKGKDKPKSSKKPKKSAIDKFIDEFDGYVIEDCGCYTGDSFKGYCRKLRSALQKAAKEKGFDSVTLEPNHYDMYGFFKKGERYVYWSFNVVRGDMPTYLKKPRWGEEFLYRTAKSDKDFTGGHNNFCKLSELVDNAYRLIEG